MRFEVKAPDGRTVVLEGDSRPTDADLDEIFASIPQKQPKQLSAEELNTIRQQADESNRRAGIDTSAKSVLNAGLEGATKGIIGGLERLANGATFGAYDWMWDKTADISGIDALSPKKRREELEKDSNATKVINSGLDIVGGIPTGGALFKGLSAGAKAVPYAGKALKYAVPTLGGAITGGLYSGFENDSLGSAGTGALTGGLVAGALDAGLRGAGKLFSAVEKVKNTPRGFENAVGTKEGARILNRAVRESDDIAERVYGKAPEALDNLNVRAMDKLDDAVKGGVDVKGRMAGAKKAYGDFIDENKANQILQGKGNQKQAQLDYILKNNPANKDSNATWIRKIEDINTLDEALKQPDWVGYNEFNPDYTSEMARKAIKSGKIKVYSSNPIEKGNFITPSKMEAQSYSGNGKIFEKEIPIKDVAWIDPTQGQYAPVSSVKSAPKVSDLGITGLTDNQKSWLNQAWTAGKRNTLEKAGSLGHLDEMSKELNKMVQGSRLANPNGVGTVATPETVALQGLKDKVDDVIEKAGLQNIKAQYRQAKALEDSFNQGLNFNPNSVKTRNITFKTPDEQSAFAQGLVERVKMNPESKNIAGKTRDLRSALRKALGEKADGVFKEMDNINKSYKNVEKVLGNAERKLSVPEPINGKVGLLREFVESPGSVVGGLADFARRWATAKSAERAAKYLLDPTLKLGNSPYEAIRQYAPAIGGLGIGNLIRKGE